LPLSILRAQKLAKKGSFGRTEGKRKERESRGELFHIYVTRKGTRLSKRRGGKGEGKGEGKEGERRRTSSYSYILGRDKGAPFLSIFWAEA